MNILFLLKSLETGGLEVVTSVLANKFVAKEHRVCVYSFLGGNNSIAIRLDPRISLYECNDYSVSKSNIETLRRALIENGIEVMVNQWGLPLVPIRTALKARKGLKVKIVSVYHNAPNFNGRTQSLSIKLLGCENYLKKKVLMTMRWIFKKVTSGAMRYNYDKSDLFLVLSESYVSVFKKFTGIRNDKKLRVMTNPITISSEAYTYVFSNKEKEIIYVRRLDFVQKRVYRVIDTWNFLEELFSDWRLTIVGDGEDRKNLENHVKALELKRVTFEGFKNPVAYYKRASILMLTSDFEGFPLVLAECMSFGVVPAVYHSFAAVDDIIEDDKDGIVLPFCPQGFQAEDMAGRLSILMSHPPRLQAMAKAAVEKSKHFALDRIYREWMLLLGGVCVEDVKSRN